LKSEKQNKSVSIEALKIKIFADGADLKEMKRMVEKPFIKGLTTNPTLMRKAGVKNYEKFICDVLKEFPEISISFEVFADDFPTMAHQAKKIASYGKNIYVKIPVTNTEMKSTVSLIKDLTEEGIKVNVTAVMTLEQVVNITEAIRKNTPAYISVFAGRVADTGRDPVPIMAECLKIIKENPSIELLWASPRELLNIFQADQIGCHIITATSNLIDKMDLIGKDLPSYSLDTVKMFYHDALEAAYDISLL